jgi:NMD protein affecting ribosome stability and mRNA decay
MADQPSTVICPICKTKAKPLDKTGDADGFDCPRHGRFKVAGTVWAQPSKTNASVEAWEAALKRAKGRKPDEWAAPVILSDDLP